MYNRNDDVFLKRIVAVVVKLLNVNNVCETENWLLMI